MHVQWIAVLAGAFASGCFFTPPTHGDLGRAEFAYDEGLFGCLFGCDASEPMAVRANTFLLVTNHDELPPFVAASSDTSVLEATQDTGIGDSSIRLTSHAAGTAQIELDDGAGELIDRVSIQVEDIQTIALQSPTIQSRYLVMMGGTSSFTLDLTDAQGRHLKGFGGVDYAYGGGIGETEVGVTSALADAIARFFAGSTREGASLDALAIGAGSIDVSAPSGATLSIPVEVVDESAVVSVTVEDQTVELGSSASIGAHAFASDGEEIHDPVCEWTSSTTSGDAVVSGQDRNTVTLDASTQSSITVTCTIGGASGSGTVQFVPPR